MKIREGYYILNRPEDPVTDAEAFTLLRFLSEDIQSAAPQIHWGFHPSRSNLSVFVGDGLNDGKNRVVIEKGPIKGGYQVLFNYYEGTKVRYTMVDLCMGPVSELHKQYSLVSIAIHTAAWGKRKFSDKRTLRIG